MNKKNEIDEKTLLELLNIAHVVKKNAYAPYSNFPVGSAILLEDGEVIEGVNIENASFPVALCAERAAMAQVITRNLQTRIKAIAVVTKSSPPGSPCGLCRQFLSEFLRPDIPIVLGNNNEEFVITTIEKLLPMPFLKSSLED